MKRIARMAQAAAAGALAAAQVAPMPSALSPIAAGPAAAQQVRTISCFARGAARTTCRLPPGTQSVSFVGPDRSLACREGETWGWSGRQLWVANGCGGSFEVALAGAGGGWGGPQGQGFAGEIRCRSDRGREQFCRADTRNRAMVVRDRSGGRCVEGQTWRVERGGIRVRGSCDGQFAYGFGSHVPAAWEQGGWQQRPDRDGPNVGGVIAGVALAAGLVALLSQAGKSNRPAGNAAARMEADVLAFPDRSRREAGACLDEAARQVGATGGTSVRLERVAASRQQAGGGWRHEAELSATWPDHAQRMTMDCIANGDRVLAFDVR